MRTGRPVSPPVARHTRAGGFPVQDERVRWDELFDDLEGQFERDQRREAASEVAARTRRERSTVGLAQQLAASAGTTMDVRLLGGATVAGVVLECGPDWVLVQDEAARPSLVSITAVSRVRRSKPEQGRAGRVRRLTLAGALGALCRDRAVVQLTDVSGGVLVGTIDAVGADFLDLAEHALDVPRRAGNVTARHLVPLPAVAVVHLA